LVAFPLTAAHASNIVQRMVELRTERIMVRCTPHEAAMVRALADAQGLSMSDIIRVLVRASYAETFGDKPSPKPKH
jgi:hypothetical protein